MRALGSLGHRPQALSDEAGVDRFGEDATREIIEARQAVAKLRDLAERYGILREQREAA